MYIQNYDINKRVNSLNSKYIKCEFNLNQMSPITKEGVYVQSTAKYMADNWRSFDEDSNVAFDRALELFDLVCENGTEADIKSISSVLIEGVQKVRDANQLMNSIKHRTSRFKTKIGTKINKKMEKLNTADDELNAKIQAAINAFKSNSAPSTSGASSSETSEPSIDNKDEMALSIYGELLNESRKIYECDRVLKNYSTISKRFNLIKMVQESLNFDPDVDDCIVKICECIDTYNSPFNVKYNTMLEMSSYVLSRAYVKYPSSKIVEMVTDYFVFNDVINECNIDDIKKIKSNSVMFKDCDFDSIDYLIRLKKDADIDDTIERTISTEMISEAVNSYGAEDVVLMEGPVKDKIDEWKKGNPEEHENDDVKKMIDDFRNQCKDKEPANNTIQLKSLINKIFTKSANQIVNGLPNIFTIIRLFFIAGTCAINPIISVVALITDKIIQNHLERKQLEKLINTYKSEMDKVKTKIEKAKSDEEKDRMERYNAELKKDLEKLKDYERNLYSEKENDEREDYSDYEFDDDFDFDFGDDDWDLDESQLESSQLNNLASILYLSELVENINEGLLDTDLDGVVYNNIFKFDNDTIDAITDFSITVPVILEKNKLREALESHREELREKNFMANIMRIDCLNENIRKINNSSQSYNVTNNTKGLICTLNWINEMVMTTNCSTILEMDFSNTVKLAMNKLKKAAVNLSDKEKKISNDIDVSMASISRGLEDALRNDNRESIIKGRILPSASKTIKIALTVGAAWAISPAIAVIGALGAFACSTKLKAKERQLVLDDIEIELKMCERYLRMAEDKNDMEAIRQIETTQRNLERQRQRIKYKMNVVYNQKVPDVAGNDD